MRGSRVATQGRARQGARLATQLTVGDEEDEDGGVVRYKLPTSKVRKARPHSLSDAVVANKRPVKKH